MEKQVQQAEAQICKLAKLGRRGLVQARTICHSYLALLGMVYSVVVLALKGTKLGGKFKYTFFDFWIPSSFILWIKKIFL